MIAGKNRVEETTVAQIGTALAFKSPRPTHRCMWIKAGGSGRPLRAGCVRQQWRGTQKQKARAAADHRFIPFRSAEGNRCHSHFAVKTSACQWNTT